MLLHRPYRDQSVTEQRQEMIRARAEAASPKCVLCGSKENLSEVLINGAKVYVCPKHQSEEKADAGV